MVDVSIVNETSPEANWNGQTDRQADGQTGRQTGLQKTKTSRTAGAKGYMTSPKIVLYRYMSNQLTVL